jgi:hypothetical protein
MLVFNKYFYKNKKLKLYFGDRVAVLNDFIYQTRGSIYEERKSELLTSASSMEFLSLGTRTSINSGAT